MKTKLEAVALASSLALGLSACEEANSEEPCEVEGGHEHEHEHDHDHGEVDGACPVDDASHGITTVTLTFTPASGESVTASFRDPDGPGGESGRADHLHLAANTTYSVRVELLAELEDEDITALIADEAEGHFVFFRGDDVSGPASNGAGFLVHEFDDLESDYGPNETGDDLPVGLSSIVTTSDAGQTDLGVVVRHLPAINDVPQKTAEVPSMYARGDESVGETDVDVTFEVEVE